MNGDNFNDVYDKLTKKIASLYSSKEYVYDSLREEEKVNFDLIRFRKGSKVDFELAISDLTGYLERYHHKKVIVLIDEYDIPIQDGYLKGYYDEVVNFIRGIFVSALKTNDSLFFAVLTGVLRVSKESLLSGFNNVKVYGLINSPIDEYFGFTESDTKNLLEYYGLELTSEVKDMYDGYDFNGVEVYNPWSILNYASDKILTNYWVNTSSNSLINDAMYKTDIDNKQLLEKVFHGNEVEFTYDERITYREFDKFNNLNILLNLLYASGYLTFSRREYDQFGERTFLRIPNKEVKEEFKRIMSESIYGTENSPNARIVAEAVRDYDMKKLEDVLNKMLMGSNYRAKEMFYEGFMEGIFSLYLNNDNYIVDTERDAGVGRCDIMIESVDRSVGYIFELKLEDDENKMQDTVNIALEQIKNKKYYEVLVHDKAKKIYPVAIVFGKKSCIVRALGEFRN